MRRSWVAAVAAVCISLPLLPGGGEAARADAVMSAGLAPSDGPVTFGKAECDRVTVTIVTPGTGRTTGRAEALREPYSILVDGKVVVSGTLGNGETVRKTVKIPVGKPVRIEVRAEDQVVASATRQGSSCTRKEQPKPKHKKPKSVCRLGDLQGSCGSVA